VHEHDTSGAQIVTKYRNQIAGRRTAGGSNNGSDNNNSKKRLAVYAFCADNNDNSTKPPDELVVVACLPAACERGPSAAVGCFSAAGKLLVGANRAQFPSASLSGLPISVCACARSLVIPSPVDCRRSRAALACARSTRKRRGGGNKCVCRSGPAPAN
jgi:hypothetical protein